MKRILKPKFEMLTPEQQELIYNLMSHFRDVDFSHVKLSSPVEVSKAVTAIASVCKNERDLEIFVDFVGQMMRWYRAPGFYLSFYLQSYTRSDLRMFFDHMKACLIYSDAQINLNNDLALDSTEVAYSTLLKVKNMLNLGTSNSLAKAIMQFEMILVNRLKFFYSFFSHWRKPFEAMECNPLADNLYYSLTHMTITTAFPDLNFKDDDESEKSYASIIQQCQHEDFRYYRVLAQRFLGVQNLGNNKTSQAIEQLKLGLDEAEAIDLETEIGHFHRLLGYALSIKGDLQNSAHHFLKAFKFDSPSCASYWRSIDARELAYVLRRAAVIGVKLPKFSTDSDELLQTSTKFYGIGRDFFDKHMIDSSNLPINKAIKLQMFRSYSENAIDQALATENLREVLAEIETNSPSEITQLTAELKAAQDLTATSISDLQKTREVFHRHLSTLPSTFEDYLGSFREYYNSRHAYLKSVIALNEKWLPFRSTSTDVVNKTLRMKLPNTHFLLFNIGRLSTYALINMADGKIKSDRAWITETQLNNINKKYIAELEKITKKMPLEQQEEMRKKAVDYLLKEYEESMAPILEPLLPDIENNHLKIFPRLQMNAVPIHALKIGDKRLIETCDVSYNQNLSLFVNMHKQEVDDLTKAPLVVYNKERTGGFLKGTIRAIEEGFAEKPLTLIDSKWPEILETINSSESTDLFFACHGVYDTTNPALSYLEVSKKEKVFFSKVFSDLNLGRYRSVVLGACESGLVKSELAYEYVGLASAFLAAGIRYFTGSLWEVNEFVTSILLSKYFELLGSDKFTVPKALNEAQRSVMNMSRDEVMDWVENKFSSAALDELKPVIENMDDYPFRHPYYWAGFYVSGDI